MQQYGGATADANGSAVITFTPRASRPARVSQVSLAMRAAPDGTTCELQLDGRYITTLIPQGDVASGEPPIDIAPGEQLQVVWAGATPGNVAEATFFFDWLR